MGLQEALAGIRDTQQHEVFTDLQRNALAHIVKAFVKDEPKNELWLDKQLRKFQGDANFEAERIILALEEALIKIKQRNGEDVAGIDYIKDKLDEARGEEFGIGDIVRWGIAPGYFCVNDIWDSPAKLMEIADIDGTPYRVRPDTLKLVFPASRIPKWLRNNEVVMLQGEHIGIEVLPLSLTNEVNSLRQYLCWNRKQGFYTEYKFRSDILRVIWPSGGA